MALYLNAVGMVSQGHYGTLAGKEQVGEGQAGSCRLVLNLLALECVPAHMLAAECCSQTEPESAGMSYRPE